MQTPSSVNDHAIAELIGMSVDFVRKDRATKRIIPFYRLGRRIRYNPERVFAALAAQVEEGGLKPRARRAGGAA